MTTELREDIIRYGYEDEETFDQAREIVLANASGCMGGPNTLEYMGYIDSAAYHNDLDNELIRQSAQSKEER